MKNEKIVEVCQVVVKVCNIALVIAQTLISAFGPKLAQKPVAEYSQEDMQLIKDFLNQENK